MDGLFVLFLRKVGLWHRHWLDEGPLLLVLLHLITRSKVHALCEESSKLVVL